MHGAGFDDAYLAYRAEAWDCDPNHHRFSVGRYRHEKPDRYRVHVDVPLFGVHRESCDELGVDCVRLIALGARLEKVLDAPWGAFEELAIMTRDPQGREFGLQ